MATRGLVQAHQKYGDRVAFWSLCQEDRAYCLRWFNAEGCKSGYVPRMWSCGFGASVPEPLRSCSPLVAVVVDGKIVWASGDRLYQTLGSHAMALGELDYVLDAIVGEGEPMMTNDPYLQQQHDAREELLEQRRRDEARFGELPLEPHSGACVLSVRLGRRIDQIRNEDGSFVDDDPPTNRMWRDSPSPGTTRSRPRLPAASRACILRESRRRRP